MSIRNSSADHLAEVKAFADWLDPGVVQLATQRRHGQWYAIVLDYNIASNGESERAAIEDALQLMLQYWWASFKAGSTFEEVRCPAPLRLRAEVQAGRMIRSAIKTAPSLIPRIVRRDVPELLEHAPSFT